LTATLITLCFVLADD